MTPAFYTLGYAQWPPARRAAKLVETLTGAGVDTLVDCRHSACPSQLAPGGPYGPRAWHLLAEGGVAPLVRAAGIDYLWAVELGNPQRQDPAMRVLKSHLADPDGGWPVHRGLALVAGLIAAGRHCGLLCACAKAAACHRRPVAAALVARLPAGAEARELTG